MLKRRKFLFSTLLIIIVVVFVTFYHKSILVSLGEYLVTEHPLEKADAIVVLSGSVPDRILEAVDIYKGGYAPLIILTKELKRPGYDELLKLGIKVPEGHDLNRTIALKLGVPSSSLMTIDRRVDSTFREIQAVYDILEKKNIKSVILVSSKSHTTRATKIFNHIASEEIKVITRPPKYDTFDPEKWWKERESLRQTLFEYEKLAHYYFVDYLGSIN